MTTATAVTSRVGTRGVRPLDRGTLLAAGAVGVVAAGVGIGAAWSPLIALLVVGIAALAVAIAMHPPLAAYLMVGVTPLVVGIDRGRLVPLLRPNEVLLLLCAAALAVRAVWDLRSGARLRLRPGLLVGALLAMAACNSVVPLLWMAVRHVPISDDDLSYAGVLWKLLLLYAVVRYSVRTPEQARRCLWVSMGVAGVVAVVAILQSLRLFGVDTLLTTYYAPFGDTSVLTTNRGSATLGLAAATADLLIFNLALAAGWWRRHGPRPWIVAPLLVLFLVGAVSSGQISSGIGLVVAIVALGLVFRRADVTAALALLVVGAVLLLGPVVAARLEGFAGTAGMPESWVGRLDNLRGYFWPRLFEHGNVVLGVEPAARVPSPDTLALPWIWIESGYTWLLWGGGIPLLACFVVVVVVAARQSLALARAPGVLGTTATGVFVAVVVVAVLMLFDPHITYRGSADLLFVLFALMASLRAGAATTRDGTSRPDTTATTHDRTEVSP